MPTNVYSNSQLQSYKNCPLQYHFYWELGLQRLDDEASDHHLRFGDAIHQGLALHYQGADWETVKGGFLNAYPVQLDENDKAKTREHGVEALAQYRTRYREEDKQWRVLEVETRSDDPWSVKPDLVLEHVDTGGIYLMDHKTTGQYLNYQYWEKYQPNSQITHYLDYARSRWGVIDGFIINAISFRFRERAYKGEPAGFWSKCERQTFNRNEFQIEQERRSRAEWIEDIERSASRHFWRTNTDACWRCQFKGICAPGWDWDEDQELIQIQYRQVCRRHIPDGYCALDRDHDGDCSVVVEREAAIEVAVEV